ncbi:CMGC/CDK protein kinase [Trichophyton tonsurans CBS 112818]|uniref:CMGC/CDK protein kinase n=1 Tax=Trichophyton tonsurans (strain CBS 112818) TaxID=647933 RepID=F2S1Q7_TRIT1|nr:CMGC/CDK protein kinase [Trichophyton tonsurans CBS 112818]
MAERSMFVYRYLTTDFLNLPVKTELPLDTTKRVLRDALKGLAALHDNNIMHNDIKANNILVDQKDDGSITDVRLGDIEDAAIVPPGCGISGRQMGNWMWRSPESHAEGPMTSPSDIFSFVVVLCTSLTRISAYTPSTDVLSFQLMRSELGAGEDILAHVIEQQISYFADEDSVQEFLELIRESAWAEVFKITRDGFNKENPRKPFALWKGMDPVFKDLICRMTHFNPRKRITAREALKYDWFKGITSYRQSLLKLYWGPLPKPQPATLTSSPYTSKHRQGGLGWLTR